MALKTVCAAEREKDLVSYCSAGFGLIFRKEKSGVLWWGWYAAMALQSAALFFKHLPLKLNFLGWAAWFCSAGAMTARSSSVLVQHGLVALMCQHLLATAEVPRPCCIIINFPKTNQPELVLVETIWRTSAHSQTCLVFGIDGGVVAFVAKTRQDHEGGALLCPGAGDTLVPPGEHPWERWGWASQPERTLADFTGCVLIRKQHGNAGKELCLHFCASRPPAQMEKWWRRNVCPWDVGICVCTRPDLQPLAPGDNRALPVPVTSGPGPHFVCGPIAAPHSQPSSKHPPENRELLNPGTRCVLKRIYLGGISAAQSRWQGSEATVAHG